MEVLWRCRAFGALCYHRKSVGRSASLKDIALLFTFDFIFKANKNETMPLPHCYVSHPGVDLSYQVFRA